MKILVIDSDEELRNTLVLRIQDALLQADLRRIDVVSGGFDFLGIVAKEKDLPFCCFLGPGCHEHVERAIEKLRATFPTLPLALVVSNDVYAEQAVELRKYLSIRIIAVADVGQMVDFVMDCEDLAGHTSGFKNRGVVTIAQLKGGVGGSTVAAGLAACWARHGLSVALLDFDDLNPQITQWGRVSIAQRKVVLEFLTKGAVDRERINEMVFPVEGYEGKLVVVGQPEQYQDSFHFKADVIDGAPSSAVFVGSLLNVLQEEFDIIVVDSGRSWGIATFAVLPLSKYVLLVTDDDGMSVRRSIDNLERLYKASDDESEFDLGKWSVVLNAYTGRLLSPKDLGLELHDLELFPDSAALYTIPFSEKGRQWGAPGESLYDLAEPAVVESLQKIASSMIPFRRDVEHPHLYDKVRKKIQKLVGPH
ncbi:MAG: ParA family protein [Deltaproteobacteria bacterium]|nr:ParA family protein [Deltaproteobacteria bacterium]